MIRDAQVQLFEIDRRSSIFRRCAKCARCLSIMARCSNCSKVQSQT